MGQVELQAAGVLEDVEASGRGRPGGKDSREEGLEVERVGRSGTHDIEAAPLLHETECVPRDYLDVEVKAAGIPGDHGGGLPVQVDTGCLPATAGGLESHGAGAAEEVEKCSLAEGKDIEERFAQAAGRRSGAPFRRLQGPPPGASSVNPWP